jgi:hypothetical protein
MRPTLEEIVAAKPYRDYADWWPMGEHFLGFMADAIHTNWGTLQDDSAEVARYAEHYICVVYGRQARPDLVGDFVERRATVEPGEFDALSYAFFRSAYEELARRMKDPETLATERRQFTRRVGKRFFSSMAEYLKLDLPTRLDTEEDHRRLTRAIGEVGAFLHQGGSGSGRGPRTSPPYSTGANPPTPLRDGLPLHHALRRLPLPDHRRGTAPLQQDHRGALRPCRLHSLRDQRL